MTKHLLDHRAVRYVHQNQANQLDRADQLARVVLAVQALPIKIIFFLITFKSNLLLDKY